MLQNKKINLVSIQLLINEYGMGEVHKHIPKAQLELIAKQEESYYHSFNIKGVEYNSNKNTVVKLIKSILEYVKMSGVGMLKYFYVDRDELVYNMHDNVIYLLAEVDGINIEDTQEVFNSLIYCLCKIEIDEIFVITRRSELDI